MALLLLKQIAALFLMILVGFVLTKLRIFRPEDSRTMSKVCIYIAVPATAIKAFQIELTDEVRSGFLLCLAGAVLFHLLMFVFDIFYRRVFRLGGTERASIAYSNAGNLLIPLVTAMFGEGYIIYTSAYFSVQQLLLWTHCQALVSGERKPDWKKLLTNCNLIAVFLGIALMLLRIRLPEIVRSALGSLGGLIGPVTMLMIGILLAGADLKSIFRNRQVYLISFARLLLTPVLMLLALRLIGLAGWVPNGAALLYIPFLAVCAPTAAMVTQLAQLHNRSPEYASAINVMTTLLCIATMPLMTALYELVMG